jgi:hypothetical protein
VLWPHRDSRDQAGAWSRSAGPGPAAAARVVRDPRPRIPGESRAGAGSRVPVSGG